MSCNFDKRRVYFSCSLFALSLSRTSLLPSLSPPHLSTQVHEAGEALKVVKVPKAPKKAGKADEAGEALKAPKAKKAHGEAF